jgi:hypothetical protein
MKFRIVAIPLFAAICLASPVIASTDGAADEQRRRDRGGDNRGGDRRGGDRDRGRDYGRQQRPGPRVRVAVPSRPIVNVNIGNRGRYYGPSYYNGWARRYYRWSPVHYAPWSLIAGSVGYANFGVYGSIGPSHGYPYPHYAHGPGYPSYASGYDFGGVRLRMRPRDAHVFVDGHYAGLVDDFDGTFQQLRLEQGGHKIEIRMPGFEDFEMDVHVQPGRTITLHEDLRPRP